MAKKPTNYVKGERIKTWPALLVALNCGQWVYMRHKAYHPGFIWGISLRAVSSYIKRGEFWLAVANPERTP